MTDKPDPISILYDGRKRAKAILEAASIIEKMGVPRDYAACSGSQVVYATDGKKFIPINQYETFKILGGLNAR